MDLKKTREILSELNQPKFRLEQIKKAVYKEGVFSFLEISNIPKSLQLELEEKLEISSFQVEKVLASNSDLSRKALLRTKDNELIETVLISPKDGFWSACISSQIGCSLGCAFCATGKMGFKRNLASEEITDQVLFWKQFFRKNKMPGSFSNVVYMGMGEPFLNWDNVKKSLNDLIDPELFGFGSRSISVSTAGIPEGIRKIARDFPQVNLAISLHFVDDKKRSKFMPINRKYDLESLRNELKKYFQKCHRKVFLEYILLSGINDSREDANRLARYLKSIGSQQLLHVNLIRYNSVPGNLRPSEKNVSREFKDYLLRKGIGVTIRKSLGGDIGGACGQLAGKKKSA
jgi:23S rRNA (adenine(2503)-C(2))-methyltransferase